MRKQKPSRKSAASAGAMDPIIAPRSPKKFRARIRMYRHGLGDCLLVTFPRSKASPFHVLIDCGVLARDKDFMMGIVRHIRDTVREGKTTGKARLDVVVGTHEHKDHLSGFNQARSFFNEEFDFGSVWLAWTENLTKPEVRKLKETKKRALRMLTQALTSPLAAAAPEVLAGIGELLTFGQDDDTTGSGKVADAMEYLKLRGKEAGDLRFLEPGVDPFRLEGVDGVRVFVLGPPRDPALLKTSAVTEQMKRDQVIYHLAHTGEAGVNALGAALSNDSAMDGDRFHPFPNEYRIPKAKEGKPNPYFSYIQNFLSKTYDDPLMAWRRVDHDWLTSIGQLALDLDNDTNNTSLVLAFEFEATRDVLLFVADAQVGSWLSFGRLKFKVPEREQLLSAQELLGRTVFYKVGHHCSHNATLRNGGLELMDRDDLVAFIPLDQATARKQGVKGWDMPAAPLFKALKTKTNGRVVLSDATEKVPVEAEQAGVCSTSTYIDYFLL